MAKKKSTMSPKRLFVLLCLAGALMWFFSNSTVDVDVEIGNENPTQKEEIVESKNEEKIEKETSKNKKRNKKKKEKKSPHNLSYDPAIDRPNIYDPSKRK